MSSDQEATKQQGHKRKREEEIESSSSVFNPGTVPVLVWNLLIRHTLDYELLASLEQCSKNLQACVRERCKELLNLWPEFKQCIQKMKLDEVEQKKLIIR